MAHDEGTVAEAIGVVGKALAHAAREGIGDVTRIEQLLSRDISRWAHPKVRSPLIIPVVIDA